MDTLGQHTSTHSMFTWAKAGPSMEGLTQLLEMCLTDTLTLFNTKISYKLQIIISPFKWSY